LKCGKCGFAELLNYGIAELEICGISDLLNWGVMVVVWNLGELSLYKTRMIYTHTTTASIEKMVSPVHL